MTNKQVIMDIADIAGCVRLQDDEISCDLGGECKGWENCYYKQLKRKEQECKELKERLESFQKDYSKLYQVVENKGYIKELDQFKTENEMLRDELRFYKDFYYAYN